MARNRPIRRTKAQPSRCRRRKGLALGLVVISLGILTALGLGLLSVGYGARRQAIAAKADLAAMLAAEAGYEKAVFWMSEQQDMLSALQQGAAGTSGRVSFPDSSSSYQISLFTFAGTRPVFRVSCLGRSGAFKRKVDVLVVQAISGWDMGMCRVPTGATQTSPVSFSTGEVIDMPVSINERNEYPDQRDIHIIGSPRFQKPVAMGESRRTTGGSDKYYGVMSLFEDGIYFDQPKTRVTDEKTVQKKIDRFRDSTKAEYRFKPVGQAAVSYRQSAVQLEFFVKNGVGNVRVTNNCTVRSVKQSQDWKTYDFKIRPGTNGTRYERYPIYAYHLAPANANKTGQRTTLPLTSTYVTQSFGGVDSEPGGQIFVDGNVVIGGNMGRHSNDQRIKGRITVVATGNIWIADSMTLHGQHDGNGRPKLNNPNVLGLLAQGVIKVVDPGLSRIDGVVKKKGFTYAPVGRPDYAGVDQDDSDYYRRHLPDPMVVEAAMTIGGGGWGAENVQRSYYGGRKETGGRVDELRVHGSISEAIRGVIGLVGSDGFLKSYHMDERLLTGIVPGDIWLRGKYVPAPAGWHDYRPGK